MKYCGERTLFGNNQTIALLLSPENFLNNMSCDQLVQLFDRLKDVCFFIKDAQGRFIYANDALVCRLRLKDRSEIVGTTDHDRYPDELADRFVRDDRKVMETGQALVNQVEVLLDELGNLDWYSTTKSPLYDDKGEVIGVMGIFRTYEGSKKMIASYSAVARSIEIVREESLISVAELARRSGVSERQLHRRFREALGMSAQAFILRNRIQGAAVLLRETDEPIASIAVDFGFCDQSAFSKQFVKQLGSTPAAYRRRYCE